MRFARPLLCLITTALLTACARPPVTAPGTANGFCRLTVAGNQVVLASGQPVTLLGPSLPTLTEMARAGEEPIARIQAFAGAGARIVSLAIDDDEVTPLYFPDKLAPVLQAANDAGVIVILSYRIRLKASDRSSSNNEIDSAEDFLKLALGYVNSAPAVWFDPILEITDFSAVRRRNIAQRMVDIVRGYRADNIILIRQADWFRESNPVLAAPLQGGNVIYALGPSENAAGLPLTQHPFLRISPSPPERAATLGLSAPGSAADDPAWARAWRDANPPNLRACP
ncbi:MAG TPA: hypothetical protein PLG23_17320 [Thermoflexales bacterium]|jgi:hypothetical protein|nr:hypothetical protein [Thermoflexales bacterium]HQZ55228.1 hypothetical protein [Thermoflexales bacterium]